MTNINTAFSHRNYGSKFVVLGYNSTYFSNKIQKGKTCYSEEQVISMLEFLIDNIFVSFGGTLFQQVVGIPMGTNCAPLLADLFLYSYESEFLQKLVKDKKIHEARAFNFTYRYIDDALSINNSRFADLRSGMLIGHDLSMCILCRFHRWLIFARVIALFMFV